MRPSYVGSLASPWVNGRTEPDPAASKHDPLIVSTEV